MEAITTEELKKKNEPAAPADDYFSVNIDTDSDMQSFLEHMKRPREEVDMPEIGIAEDDSPEKGSEERELDDNDRQNLAYLNYDDEHRMTAEFMLVQLDKGMAFVFSSLSGKPMDGYRTRTEKPKGEDYEAELAAALLKKYQLRMSLEFAFGMAMLMRYSPMYAKAVQDRKKQKVEEAKAQKEKDAA